MNLIGDIGLLENTNNLTAFCLLLGCFTSLIISVKKILLCRDSFELSRDSFESSILADAVHAVKVVT